jgi:RNA polymerase sigma-70 factor (ECF subfamily)
MDPVNSSSFYADLYPLVARVVRVTLGADSEQEDVLQNAFLQVISHIGSLRDPSKLKSWAATIAVHSVRHELRRRRRQRRVLRFDISEDSVLLGYEPDFERGLRQERARSALAALAARDRELLSLWLAGAGTIAEIAHELGCSLSTASRRLRRARRALARSGA